MYSVLIAEDEILVRAGLKSLVNWNGLGLEIIADASNGVEAFEAYEQHKPDLIITDIKMPQMDGMELIKKIRKYDSKVRIIILTCLEEFELVRKAMEFGVDGYILKLTMTRKEMEDVLQRSIDKLLVHGEFNDGTAIQNKPNLYILKEELFRNYFVLRKCSSEEFGSGMVQLGMDLKGKKIITACMEIDHFGLFLSKCENREGMSKEASIFDIIEGIVKKFQNCYTASLNDSKYLIILGFERMTGEQKIFSYLTDILMNVKESLKRYFELSVSFGLSCIRDDVHLLDNMYLEASAALDFKFYKGIGTINYSSEQNDKKVIREKLERLKKAPVDMAKLGCIGEYNSRVMNFISEGCQSVGKTKDFFMHLLQMTAFNSLIDNKIFEDLVISYTGIIHECETFDEMYSAFEEYIKSAVSRGKEHVSYSKGIADSLEYIKRHYNEDISLNHVAELVSLSPNYFSGLFKKEMDMNFSEYIINYRIEKAKELLLGTRLLAYEISQRVGFFDGAYFSRTFKKITGFSPNEFRKKWFEG